MQTKRYWLFAGANYYPSGGMNDFYGAFDTVNEALEFFNKPEVKKDYIVFKEKFDWCHILDTEEMTILNEFGEFFDEVKS